MGKGQIISEISGGQYSIQLLFDKRITTLLSQITAQIVALEAKEDRTDKEDLFLTSLRLGQRKLQAIQRKASNQSVWCADLTEGLTGEIATIEIPGETDQLWIRPGYDGRSVWDYARDGMVRPAEIMTSEESFWNAAMGPGVKKWMPHYRTGTIIAIDGDTCNITLDAQTDIIGFDVNSMDRLLSVPIEYMECDGGAFSIGDEIIVEFIDQDPGNPKVIGFKDNPKVCPYSRCAMLFWADDGINTEIWTFNSANQWEKYADIPPEYSSSYFNFVWTGTKFWIPLKQKDAPPLVYDIIELDDDGYTVLHSGSAEPLDQSKRKNLIAWDSANGQIFAVNNDGTELWAFNGSDWSKKGNWPGELGVGGLDGFMMGNEYVTWIKDDNPTPGTSSWSIPYAWNGTSWRKVADGPPKSLTGGNDNYCYGGVWTGTEIICGNGEEDTGIKRLLAWNPDSGWRIVLIVLGDENGFGSVWRESEGKVWFSHSNLGIYSVTPGGDLNHLSSYPSGMTAAAWFHRPLRLI